MKIPSVLLIGTGAGEYYSGKLDDGGYAARSLLPKH